MCQLYVIFVVGSTIQLGVEIEQFELDIDDFIFPYFINLPQFIQMHFIQLIFNSRQLLLVVGKLYYEKRSFF